MVTAIKEDCSAIIDYKLLCGFKCGKVHPSSNKKKVTRKYNYKYLKLDFIGLAHICPFPTTPY